MATKANFDVLAVTNDKGGVGKTTSVVNMALALTDEPWEEKVLVIDLDAQMNACMNLGWNPEWEKDMRPTLFSALCGQVDQLTAYYSDYEGCFYIPASKRMVNVEPFIRSQNEPLYVLRELFQKPIRVVDPGNGFQEIGQLMYTEFGKVLLDCPPSMGIITMNAWAVARSLLVAFQTESYCMEGLRAIVSNYVSMAKKNKSLQLRGILRTMYQPRLRITKDIDAALQQEMSSFLLQTVIPRSTAVTVAQKSNSTIMFDDPQNAVSVAYRKLLEELYGGED